ncbi:hypothetical protein K3495_g15944, partial [Podosphaera aphanis]
MQQLTFAFSDLSLSPFHTSTEPPISSNLQISPNSPNLPDFHNRVPFSQPKMSRPSYPKPSEIAEFKGKDAVRWVKSHRQVWLSNNWTEDIPQYSEFIDYIECHMTPGSAAAQFFDNCLEIQRIMAKDVKTLEDVVRVEVLLKQKFPKLVDQIPEENWHTKLDSIIQGEKSLTSYYQDT